MPESLHVFRMSGNPIPLWKKVEYQAIDDPTPPLGLIGPLSRSSNYSIKQYNSYLTGYFVSTDIQGSYGENLRCPEHSFSADFFNFFYEPEHRQRRPFVELP